ncbi:MAG: hypothetical protein R6T92_07345 [Desulfosalsimonadaceae bacterium]
MLTASNRVKNVAFAGNRVIFEKAKELERAGNRIIHMEVGRPDFDSPEAVKQACRLPYELFYYQLFLVLLLSQK